MSLSATEIRELLVKSVNSLIKYINSYELPIRQSGTEVFGKEGYWVDVQTDEKRYWLSCILTTSNQDELQRLEKVLSLRFGENLG